MAKTGVLDIVINNLKHKLTITTGIYLECTAKKESFDANIIKRRIEDKLIDRKDVQDKVLFEKIKKDFKLGTGEAEAIVFCIKNKIGLITDDKRAINTCKILGINFATLPNILVQLSRRKVITKEETGLYFDKLQRYGRYSAFIIQKVREELKNEKNE